jgi:2-oxoglutarate ferredoxin oxidoreductase subunit beta
VATGVKLGNHELNVIATGGDGDGYGIGGNHFAHTARRNVDLTYIVMNNQIYGLTTGQLSPTSSIGMKTKSTPFGSVELPVNPITTAIMNGATFVARGYSSDIRHLTGLMKKAIQHKGFSLVDIFSPCVTFNHDNDNAFFKDRVKKLEDEGHDTSDWKTACEKAMMWGDTIYTGLFFQRETPDLGKREPVLDEGGPLARRSLGLNQDQVQKIIRRMM